MNKLDFILDDAPYKNHKRISIVEESITATGNRVRCWQDPDDARVMHIELEYKPKWNDDYINIDGSFKLGDE